MLVFTEFQEKLVEQFAEECHTLKGQEEAKERYRVALEYAKGSIVYKDILAGWLHKALRIAAGKEEG